MYKMGIEKGIYKKIQKGISTILTERHLWEQLSNKRLTCKYCSHELIGPVEKEFCCALRCLSVQEDFMKQRIWLKEIVEDRGHRLIFFPKYHCELNFIEMVWGYIKRMLRSECTYDFQALLNKIDTILLDRIPISFIRKAERRCFRYMSGYRYQLKGPLLDFAVKKYKSHRGLPESFNIANNEKDYKVYRDKKFKKCTK